MKSKNFDLMAIRTLQNCSSGRVCVHMLIERIFQCKNLCKLEPFEGHFGAVASYLSIRDLKIRRRRVSTTVAVSWGEWEEVAVVWRENCP